MSDSVAQKVIGVIAKYRKIPAESITMNTTFDELGIDSLDGINLVFELEEEFNLSIPDDRAFGMKTVGQIVEGIEKLVTGDGTGGVGATVES